MHELSCQMDVATHRFDLPMTRGLIDHRQTLAESQSPGGVRVAKFVQPGSSRRRVPRGVSTENRWQCCRQSVRPHHGSSRAPDGRSAPSSRNRCARAASRSPARSRRAPGHGKRRICRFLGRPSPRVSAGDVMLRLVYCSHFAGMPAGPMLYQLVGPGQQQAKTEVFDTPFSCVIASVATVHRFHLLMIKSGETWVWSVFAMEAQVDMPVNSLRGNVPVCVETRPSGAA